MKRFAFIAALLPAAALAVGNPDPVRTHEEQFLWLYPQFFNQQLSANFIDAGIVTATTTNLTTVNATLVKATTLDAGSALINGQLQVTGAIRADSSTLKISLVDAGSMLVNNEFRVGGASVLQAITGTDSTLSGTEKVAIIDAGVGLFNGELRASGPINALATIQIGGKVADSATLPTVTACSGGTAASITWASSTGAFVFDVGTACTSESTAVLTFPASTNGWICSCSSTTADRAVLQKVIPPANATTVTMQNIVISTGANGDFTDGADVGCICRGG